MSLNQLNQLNRLFLKIDINDNKIDINDNKNEDIIFISKHNELIITQKSEHIKKRKTPTQSEFNSFDCNIAKKNNEQSINIFN